MTLLGYESELDGHVSRIQRDPRALGARDVLGNAALAEGLRPPRSSGMSVHTDDIVCARVLGPQGIVADHQQGWLLGASMSAPMLGALPVAIPAREVQDDTATVLQALDDKIVAHERIIDTAEKLRVALLTRMLSDRR